MRSRAVYSFAGLTLTLALASVVFFTQAIAQTRQQPKIQPATEGSGGGDPGATPSILVATGEDYRIGPRDVIEIKVDDAPELCVSAVSVNADGTFLMPYLKRLRAAGKTTDELAKEIGDGLRGRYLKDPNVMVFVKQFNSRAIYILGAVKKPGVYQIEGKPSLLTLLTVAGGLADNHGTTAIILHPIKKDTAAASEPAGAKAIADAAQTTSPPAAATSATGEDETDYAVRTININGIYKGLGLSITKNPEAYLEPGDLINIPPADTFFVSGEVVAPGQFPLNDGTTLRQALALAQGTTMNAATGEGVIFRTDPATGRRDEIKVDVGAIMKNRKPDVALVANDIVLVPNSKMKTFGNTMLKALGMSAAQRGTFIR